MKLYLQLSFAEDTLFDLGKDAPRRRLLLAELEAAGVLDGLTHVYAEGAKKGRRVPSWPALKGVEGDPIHAADAETLDAATRVAQVQVAFDRATLKVEGSAGKAELNRLAKELDAIVTTAEHASVELFEWCGIRVLDAELRYPGAPRDLGPIEADGVVDLINVELVASLPGMEEVLRAFESRLPEGVTTRAVGRYRLVNWAAGAGASRAALEDALAARLAWYAKHGDFPVLEGFNEQGDRAALLFKPVRDPFYTFYIPFSGSAFKALADLPAAPEEDEQIAAIMADLERGKTEAGRKLASVSLIFPTRKLALKHRAVALELGFKTTLYPDGEGSFWEPAPEEA